jgi:hypothetical protein
MPNVSKFPPKWGGRVKYLLCCRRDNLEMGIYVTAEYTCFKGFNMTADICLRRQEVAFVHVAILFFVSIWHNDVSATSLHLNAVLMTVASERLEINIAPSEESRTTFHCLF